MQFGLKANNLHTHIRKSAQLMRRIRIVNNKRIGSTSDQVILYIIRPFKYKCLYLYIVHLFFITPLSCQHLTNPMRFGLSKYSWELHAGCFTLAVLHFPVVCFKVQGVPYIIQTTTTTSGQFTGILMKWWISTSPIYKLNCKIVHPSNRIRSKATQNIQAAIVNQCLHLSQNKWKWNESKWLKIHIDSGFASFSLWTPKPIAAISSANSAFGLKFRMKVAVILHHILMNTQ